MKQEMRHLIEKIHMPDHKVLVAAPMAGISNRPFRRLMRRLGSEFSVSELISAKGLIYGQERTHHMVQISDDERPSGIQIFGEDRECMVEAAKIIEDKGADFVDINFGCPVKKVVTRGAGAGWAKRPAELEDLLSGLVKAVSIPVTIKIRTGWDSDQLNAPLFCKIAQDCGILWVAIHGRTRTQGYKGKADWDYLNHVVDQVSIPIIGNGDILTKSDLLKRERTFKGAGLMIGRGILHDPLLLASESIAHWSFLDVFQEYLSLAEQDFDERFLLSQAKKFAAWYSSGFPKGNHFRKEIFSFQSVDCLKDFAFEFLEGKSSSSRIESPHLLMGGHG